VADFWATLALGVGRAALVGASIGRWMATIYALARPDRVARLALVSPAGIVGSLRVTWLLKMTVKTQFPPTAAKAQWMLDHLVVEKTRPQLRADPWRPIAEQFIFGMPHFRSNLREPRPGMRCDVAPLAASPVPVLALIPRDETGHNGPLMAQRYCQRLPHAHVQLVADSNHLMFIDRTDVVTDQLQKFLDEE
jgi:pimeloyl-ACP methyl ester carboxylesterase